MERCEMTKKMGEMAIFRMQNAKCKMQNDIKKDVKGKN